MPEATMTELEKIQLENAQLDKKIKESELRKKVQEVEQYEMREKNRQDNARRKGVALQEQTDSRRKLQNNCSHKMGGKGRAALIEGRGNDDKYAVSKTKYPTGDVVIRCPRCKKTWAPPFEEHYQKSPVVDKAKFATNGVVDLDKYYDAVRKNVDKAALQKAWEEYNFMYNVPGVDQMGVMPQYRWERNGKPINREVTYRMLSGAHEFAL